MYDKKLITLSGLVCNIAVRKKDGNCIQSGTALFIKHNADYYAVTAKHCFIDGSTQVGKTSPTLENTHAEASFITGLDALGKISLLHQENLHNGRRLLFNVYYTSENQAIDVAALKLTNPSDDIKRLAIDSDYLDNSGTIYYSDKLAITGFPSCDEDHEETIITNFSPKEIQKLLDEEHEYYFLMPSNKDLRVRSLVGISGAAILDLDTQKIIGFVAGENKGANLIYGIYAKYMYELLK